MFVKSVTRGKKSPARKGSVLVEYGLLVAGVALIAMAAVSTLGHKTTDLIATVAAVIPGAHQGDNNPIQSGHLIETTVGANGIAINPASIIAGNNTSRLDNNVFGNNAELGLVLETQDPGKSGG